VIGEYEAKKHKQEEAVNNSEEEEDGSSDDSTRPPLKCKKCIVAQRNNEPKQDYCMTHTVAIEFAKSVVTCARLVMVIGSILAKRLWRTIP